MKWIILASILNLFLALFVWFRNPKDPLNYSFGIFGIIAAFLTFFDFLFIYFCVIIKAVKCLVFYLFFGFYYKGK